jgi:hypothetical protein
LQKGMPDAYHRSALQTQTIVQEAAHPGFWPKAHNLKPIGQQLGSNVIIRLVPPAGGRWLLWCFANAPHLTGRETLAVLLMPDKAGRLTSCNEGALPAQRVAKT